MQWKLKCCMLLYINLSSCVNSSLVYKNVWVILNMPSNRWRQMNKIIVFDVNVWSLKVIKVSVINPEGERWLHVLCTDIRWYQNHSDACWLVDFIEDLRRFSGISVINCDLEAGDNQSLKFKWRDRESNPGTLAPQAKSLTTRPLLLLFGAVDETVVLGLGLRSKVHPWKVLTQLLDRRVRSLRRWSVYAV